MKFKKITTSEILRKKPTIKQMRLRKRNPIYAIFHDIRSKYNVGAMFRTSDAALVAKVFLTGITPCPPHKNIDKSALGATDVVPFEYCPDCRGVIEKLKSEGVTIVALELTRESIPYCEMNCDFPVCLIVGDEVDGIPQGILDLCDNVIDIPMLGKANSLNVATAYGIAIFEILKQHQCSK